MKIVVFSDSHGKLDWMIAAMEAERPNHVFFLGDHERDGWDLSKLYPMIPLNAVKGNCDWGPGLEDWVVELSGIRFLLTHGHRYGAKSSLSGLMGAAMRTGADVVCYGHTHIPACHREEGMAMLFNPGTVGGVYSGKVTYGVIVLDDKNIRTEIKDADMI